VASDGGLAGVKVWQRNSIDRVKGSGKGWLTKVPGETRYALSDRNYPNDVSGSLTQGPLSSRGNF